MATLRHSANCPCCGIKLISPEWSESVSAENTLNLWHCPICGTDFETTDRVVEEMPPISEITEEFMPNLLVA
jgi:transcription elongation factor Elf1